MQQATQKIKGPRTWPLYSTLSASAERNPGFRAEQDALARDTEGMASVDSVLEYIDSKQVLRHLHG